MNPEALTQQFFTQLEATGLVAILRGIRPTEVDAIAAVLYEAGFRFIEIPMNSPDPLRSIARLAATLPADALVGAGTVMTAQQVHDIREAGGRLIVMPHADAVVITSAVEAGLITLPGVATPTEAFQALAAGATALKAFPAELLSPAVVKAWRAVLPQDTRVLPVGGITPDKLQPYLQAGAAGFGLGGALYHAGDGPDEAGTRARAFMARWRQAKA